MYDADVNNSDDHVGQNPELRANMTNSTQRWKKENEMESPRKAKIIKIKGRINRAWSEVRKSIYLVGSSQLAFALSE